MVATPASKSFGTTSPSFLLRSSQITFMRQAQRQTWRSPPPTVARGWLSPLTWLHSAAKHEMHAQVGHQIRLKPCGFSQGTLDIREANDRRNENTTLRQRQIKMMLPVGAKPMLRWRLAPRCHPWSLVDRSSQCPTAACHATNLTNA